VIVLHFIIADMSRFAALSPFPLAFLVALWRGLPGAEGYGEMDKFIIVSSPEERMIAYAPLSTQELVGEVKLRELITSSDGLVLPQGLAVDPWRRYLYVADPALNNLVYYVLEPSGDRLYVGKQKIAAEGVEVRWVSVDNLGNVYFTVENTQKIMRITAEQLDRGDKRPQTLFQGTVQGSNAQVTNGTTLVNAPGGIAIDNYFVYWTNKLNPDVSGTIVRSLHAAAIGPMSTATELSNLNAKCFGVCMTGNNVFFTGETKNVYGMSRLGGAKATTISSDFTSPRGCAFDGFNTVYVADRREDKVKSFPANIPSLSERFRPTVQTFANFKGAFGVTVYTVSESAGAFAISPSVLALLPALFALVLSGM
jgi:DNA-binding beta-propeller fold protein YncE